MLDAVLLLVGFLPLVFGADLLVDSASSLAKKLNIPNIVIGLTIVAFGTSAPELVVNVVGALSGSSDIALGNVIGSNIFNILAILGISAVILPLNVQTNTTWLEIPLCFLSALVVLVVANDVILDRAAASFITRADGVVLLLFFAIFLVYNIQMMKRGNESENIEVKTYSVGKAILFIVLGLVLLVVGGRLVVTSAIVIARSFEISERIIALTIVSIGTSLPELATSVAAARKKNPDMAIGNVVGSNIFNVFFILGLSAVINPVRIGTNANIDILVNLVSSLLLFVFVFSGKGRKVERWEGITFLLLFAAYVTVLLL